MASITQIEELFDRKMKTITEEQEKTLEKVLGPLRKDVEEVKVDIRSLKDGQNSLEARVMALETGQSAGGGDDGWKPKYVDICGFCKFEEVAAKGVTRTVASALVERLKAQLDPNLKNHVRDIQLRSGRNFKVRVPITRDYCLKVKNSWNDLLGKAENEYEGSTLWAQVERHPDVQAKYEKLGKVSDWAKEKLHSKYEPKVLWAPDFALMITTSELEGAMGVKPGGPLCEVGLKGAVAWDAAGLQAVEMTESQAEDAVKRYRRTRRN